ncbi:unnamed protein product [Brassicogethes aeneus]|uniref:Galactose mutarotase n=1 Tax=Brassicogethes aeneus TaxID=1431903 RepID=A0A9P0B6V9_BRAAE|nr:unnamed protein product [Brassicogethes aeneus]
MNKSRDKNTEYNPVQLEEDQFGLYADKTTGESASVRKFTWRNKNNVVVQVITYGATITSIKVPDNKGLVEDIALGFPSMEGYTASTNQNIGCTVGRVANRVGYGQINIDGTIYNVSANLGQHQLHGGFKGFDKVNWDYHRDGTKVVMSHHSPDKDEGYPGDLIVNVTFELTNNNDFLVDFKAYTTKPTFVNLTNHSYFNLAGHGKGAEELYKHVVCINADQTTDVDENSIPSGKLLSVSGTIFDLRIPTVLGERINKIPGYLGYDHNFCITKGTDQGTTYFARVVHPPSGRVLELYSNQPGVQFYTSNHLPEKGKGDSCESDAKHLVKGKEGKCYWKHGGFCLETQNYPDAVNHSLSRKSKVTLQDSELLVSFDRFLFPNVPVPLTLTYLEDLLKENSFLNETFAEYPSACMRQNCFQVNGCFYKQHEGTKMGNSLTPFLADIFMRRFEKKLNSSWYFPKDWLRGRYLTLAA